MQRGSDGVYHPAVVIGRNTIEDMISVSNPIAKDELWSRLNNLYEHMYGDWPTVPKWQHSVIVA